MNSKMIEYQMFTKCNLKCPYCYNYFDQTVYELQEYIDDLKKISVLVDSETRFVINGGEPFLLKDLAQLINSIDTPAKILTYTNCTLPMKVYEKFVNNIRKDNLHLTISVHYAELLRTNNFNEHFKENAKYLIQHIPNAKVNIVFTEDFLSKQFTEDVTNLLYELKSAGLKYINVLLQDELKANPTRAIKLVSTQHFKQFFKELKMFEYKHCMWNNRDTDVSCLQMWLRKEVMNPGDKYKKLSILKYKNEFVIERNFDIDSQYLVDNKTTNLDGLIEDIKPVL